MRREASGASGQSGFAGLTSAAPPPSTLPQAACARPDAPTAETD